MSLDTCVPKQLHDLQKWFARIIALPIQNTEEYGLPSLDKKLAKEALLHMKDGPKLSAVQRVAIYNQQYWFRLLSTMQDIFPFMLRLFGFEAFAEEIATPYLLAHPPSHWSLNELGNKLPLWIEKNYHEKDKRLILEAAVLDEAYDRLFFAGHLPHIGKMLPGKKLYLQTSLSLFHLSSNVFSLRKALLKETPEYWQENDFPKISWGPKRYFVLYREPLGDIVFKKIEAGQYLLLQAFQKGATLEEVITKVIDRIDSKGIEDKMKKWFYDWVKKGFLSFG